MIDQRVCTYQKMVQSETTRCPLLPVPTSYWGRLHKIVLLYRRPEDHGFEEYLKFCPPGTSVECMLPYLPPRCSAGDIPDVLS